MNLHEEIQILTENFLNHTNDFKKLKDKAIQEIQHHSDLITEYCIYLSDVFLTELDWENCLKYASYGLKMSPSNTKLIANAGIAEFSLSNYCDGLNILIKGVKMADETCINIYRKLKKISVTDGFLKSSWSEYNDYPFNECSEPVNGDNFYLFVINRSINKIYCICFSEDKEVIFHEYIKILDELLFNIQLKTECENIFTSLNAVGINQVKNRDFNLDHSKTFMYNTYLDDQIGIMIKSAPLIQKTQEINATGNFWKFSESDIKDSYFY